MKGAFTMNANQTMYETQPAVSGLNSVPGFDPRKFMRRTVSEQTRQEVLYLDLKYKKLWFRLAYPKGRIKKTALKITEQIAIMEAKIYFDKDDAEPVASFIAQRNAGGKPGSLYIESAQYAAENQALVDAGFGLQFCDISQGPDNEQYDAGIPVGAAVSTADTAVPDVKTAQVAEAVGDTPTAAVEPTPKEADEQPLTDEQAAIIMAATAAADAASPGPQADAPLSEAAVETQTAQQGDLPAPQPDTAAAETPDAQVQDETSSQSVPLAAAETADEDKPVTQTILEIINGGAPQNNLQNDYNIAAAGK